MKLFLVAFAVLVAQPRYVSCENLILSTAPSSVFLGVGGRVLPRECSEMIMFVTANVVALLNWRQLSFIIQSGDFRTKDSVLSATYATPRVIASALSVPRSLFL